MFVTQLHAREVEPIRRDECRCVEQHVPAPRLRAVHQRERVLHAREIGLRREREQFVR